MIEKGILITRGHAPHGACGLKQTIIRQEEHAFNKPFLLGFITDFG